MTTTALLSLSVNHNVYPAFHQRTARLIRFTPKRSAEKKLIRNTFLCLEDYQCCSITKVTWLVNPNTGPRGAHLHVVGTLQFVSDYKPTQLAHFLFCSCVCFCLCGLFNCIPLHKFSRPLSNFSLCSSSLISVLLVLSTTSLHESLLQPCYNP